MLIIINSAKTQKRIPRTDLPTSQPQLADRARKLCRRCRKLSKEEIIRIMKVSEKLGDSTHHSFQHCSFPHDEQTDGPALTTFAGDLFSEIHHHRFTREDFLFAQRHLRILSGLYGILRPLDLMQPYRLEMGYKVDVGKDANLYAYWSESITYSINRDLRQTGSSLVLNCASKEYSRALLREKLEGTLLTLTFRQKKNGATRTIAIYSKRARGMFVDWFITNHIETREQIFEFDRGGYRYVEELSGTDELVFVTELAG